MEKHRVKLNSSLEFTEDEVDIYSLVADLSRRRKLTGTIMGLIRMYYGNPGKFEGLDIEKYTDENRQAYLNTLKVSQEKYEREVDRKLNYLAQRLLTLEAELKKMYTLAESGKLLGITPRAEVTYCADVQLKASIRSLSAELGHKVNMEPTVDLEAECEDIMAYIIEHYDGAINELKQMLQTVGAVAVQTQVVTQATAQPMEQPTVVTEAISKNNTAPIQQTAVTLQKELEAKSTEQVLQQVGNGEAKELELPSNELLSEFENMFGVNFSF